MLYLYILLWIVCGLLAIAMLIYQDVQKDGVFEMSVIYAGISLSMLVAGPMMLGLSIVVYLNKHKEKVLFRIGKKRDEEELQ